MVKPRQPNDSYIKPPSGSNPVTNVPGTGSEADIDEPPDKT